MKLSSRSFPHPVVGNADDVPESEFQATLDFALDKTNVYLTATVRCSSRTLLKMIAKGTACYTLHVECSNTLFRKTFDFATETHREIIPVTQLNDWVEVNAFVRAKLALPKYAVEGAHDDYGEATFPVAPGDILAVGDGRAFRVIQDVDPLKKIGALMVVVKSPHSGDHPMEADFAEDKIRISLCEGDYKTYEQLKSVPKLTSHLTTTLVLPVLVEAIRLLADSDDPPTGKWADLLQRQLDALGLAENANALDKAQKLLDLPIKRALASANSYTPESGS